MRKSLEDRDIYLAKKEHAGRTYRESIFFTYHSMQGFYFVGRYFEIEWGDILIDIYAQGLADHRKAVREKLARLKKKEIENYYADKAELKKRIQFILSRRFTGEHEYLDSLKRMYELAYYYRRKKLKKNKVFLGEDLVLSYYKSPKKYLKLLFFKKIKYSWVYFFKKYEGVGIRGYVFDKFFWIWNVDVRKRYELAYKKAYFRKYFHLIFRSYFWRKHKSELRLRLSFFYSVREYIFKLAYKKEQDFVYYDLF